MMPFFSLAKRVLEKLDYFFLDFIGKEMRIKINTNLPSDIIYVDLKTDVVLES